MFSVADSSANSSPKRTKRPLSLVCDYKQLPAITETTELQSLGHPAVATPQKAAGNDYFSLFRMANQGGNVNNNNNNIAGAENYKIDPQIVKKAEDLLGGNNHSKASLDNTDLTITSLNFIDEYQNSCQGRNLQTLYANSPDLLKK